MSPGFDGRSRDGGIYVDGRPSNDHPAQKPGRRPPMEDERRAVQWLETWAADEHEGREPLPVPSVPAG